MSTELAVLSLAYFIMLSPIATVVESTVVVVPFTVKSPETVKLSPIVTSEVPWPINTVSPEVLVPIVIALPSASILSRLIIPTLSILPSEASKPPADIVLLPTSIAPKPDVIEPEFKAPTLVSEEPNTVDLIEVPLNVGPAAVIVIAAEPLKSTPLIALAVVSVAAEPVVF